MNYDVLIAGTGAAGLYAALNFDPGVKILLLAKGEMNLSNSALAQGGVAAVIDEKHDNYRLHIADTLIAGGYKNNLDALEALVTEGPSDIRHLIELGVEFDKDENGQLQMTLEGGHSRHRIVYHKDTTGREIVEKLIAQVRKYKNITVLENAQLWKLEQADGGLRAQVLHEEENQIIEARYVILATGGIGRVYQYTTNSAIATGDGIMVAHELGAIIKDLSLVQFHPTAFAAAPECERFLISEAVRGEGAVLLNCRKERFMSKYDEREELAPRDAVSRAIIKESLATGSRDFYLDISRQDGAYIKERFPNIYQNCLQAGYDMTKEPIPIFPCQHYLMGGIDVNLHSRTTVERLYAVGECSHTGVHGANRLGSNSLLEALVFSRRAVGEISTLLQQEKEQSGLEALASLKSGESREQASESSRMKAVPEDLKGRIRAIMQEAYFVVPDLEKARAGLGEVRKMLELLNHHPFKLDRDLVETKSMAVVASIILQEVLEHDAASVLRG